MRNLSHAVIIALAVWYLGNAASPVHLAAAPAKPIPKAVGEAKKKPLPPPVPDIAGECFWGEIDQNGRDGCCRWPAMSRLRVLWSRVDGMLEVIWLFTPDGSGATSKTTARSSSSTASQQRR